MVAAAILVVLVIVLVVVVVVVVVAVCSTSSSSSSSGSGSSSNSNSSSTRGRLGLLDVKRGPKPPIRRNLKQPVQDSRPKGLGRKRVLGEGEGRRKERKARQTH